MYIKDFAQGIPKIDAEVAQNSRFWMETSSVECGADCAIRKEHHVCTP